MDEKKILCIRSGLRRACTELSSRGLYLSSKWTAEQLFGMIPEQDQAESRKGLLSSEWDSDGDDDEDYDLAAPSAGDEYLTNSTREMDYIQLGQSLILNGEYLRCAHLLRNPQGSSFTTTGTGTSNFSGNKNNKMNDNNSSNNNSSSSNSNVKVKSSHGIFLANYSLYMAGEKLKDQTSVEQEGRDERLGLANNNANNDKAGGVNSVNDKAAGVNGKGQVHTGLRNDSSSNQPKNPFLADIFKELWPLYESTMQSKCSHNHKLTLILVILLITMHMYYKDLMHQILEAQVSLLCVTASLLTY
jgi:hypothetical protein